MKYRYFLEPDDEEWLVRFPDVPEALTGVADPETEAEDIADCLATALAGYSVDCRNFPRPTSGEASGYVTVPALIQAKLALMRALAETGTTRLALAGALGRDPKHVQRLLNLDHRSHIGDVEAALAILGRRIDLRAA